MALYQSGSGIGALVGVGTTNPTSNLQVYGTPIAAGNVFSVLNTAASGNVAQFSSSAGTALIINANGNVGIGKTNPGTLLDVNGALTATTISGTTLTASTSHNTSGSGVYQVAGTTVVDSSRNLTNIGTVSATTITGSTDASFNSVTVGIGSGSVATNTAIGKYALLNNTTGSLNTAVGESAMYTNSTGLQNTALGARALYYNTGSTNTAVGDQAMYNNIDGVSGTAVGNQTLYTNTSGQYNTAVGQRALFLTSTGGFNTALGERTMYNNSTGTNNTAVGQNALSTNTTGSNNTALGKDAGPASTALTNTTCIGYNASASISNSVILGNGANVGIGTASPGYLLDVLGIVRAGSTVGTSIYLTNSEVKWRGDGTAHYSIFNQNSTLQIRNTSGNSEPGTAGSNLVTITTTGNVGIGTTANINSPLTVYNSASTSTYTGTTAWGNIHLMPQGAENSWAGISFGGSSSGTIQQSTQASITVDSNSGTGTNMRFNVGFLFASGALERLTILGQTGFVGIANKSPDGLLTVGSSAHTSAAPLRVYHTYNSYPTAIIQNLSTGTAAVTSLALGDSVSNNRGGIALFGTGYTAAAQYRTSGTYVYSNASGGLTMHAEGANNMYFATNNVERIRISSGGYVGIGADPVCQLHLYSSGTGGQIGMAQQNDNTPYYRMGMETAYGAYSALNAYWTGSAWNYVTTGGYGGLAVMSYMLSGYWGIFTTSGGTNPISWTERMRVTNGGYVGIGTGGPQSILHAAQNCNATTDIDVSSGQFMVSSANNVRRLMIGYDCSTTNGYGWIKCGNYQVTWTPLCLQQNGGNVGIGTTNPVYKHHVYAADSSYSYYGPNATWGAYLKVGAGNTYQTTTAASINVSNGNLHIDCATGAYQIYLNYFQGGGSVNASTGCYGAFFATGDVTAFSSDERLKTKVGLIENALDKVCSLTAFKYIHNDVARANGFTDDKVYVGLSAQEVQKVLPEVVKPAPFDQGTEYDVGLGKSKSGENYLTIQYERIVSLLVESVKEERKAREALTCELRSLEERIKLLEQK